MISFQLTDLTVTYGQCYDYSSLSLKEEMPMENIKQSLSDLVHSTTAIVMITLFLFSVNPTTAEKAKASMKTEVQLKQEKMHELGTMKYTAKQQLTDKDLIFILESAGFQGLGLKKAWAIAKTESNGRPLAYNGNRKTGDSSYGIFQINMLGQLGVVRKEKFDLVSNEQLFNPVTNAEITYYMTNGGTNWSAWKGLTPRAQEWLTQYPY
jgi:hypothetical protein